MKILKLITIRLNLYHTVLVSLLFHLALGILVYFSVPKLDDSNILSVQIIEKAPVSAKSRTPVALDTNEMQIVEQQSAAINNEITQTRFYSIHNQKVIKQTVASHVGTFQNIKERIKHIDINNFKPRLDLRKAARNLIIKEKEFNAKAESRFRNFDVPVNINTSQTTDYLKDIDTGLETSLSTREFIYYSYYSRIRSQLNQYWSAEVKSNLAQYAKNNPLVSISKDKITKCMITLDSLGNLTQVQIIEVSGIKELDEAALSSFRSAAPFPNPPHGIQDQDGNIRIRWDFILEI
jgi:protein TonB